MTLWKGREGLREIISLRTGKSKNNIVAKEFGGDPGGWNPGRRRIVGWKGVLCL